jgi:hypothetical protein
MGSSNSNEFPVETVPVDSLELTTINLDESTVQKADVSKPIVLAEIAPRRFNVIDGSHRVGRARRDGIKMLPAYRVGPAVHVRFLTTVGGYKVYVQYWNGKVADMGRAEKTPEKQKEQA